MAAKKPSKQETQKIRSARTLITSIYRKDANEATTRQRIERVFMNVMGYDPLLHLSREHAVHGAGDTEHVDFAIQLEDDPDAPPKMMVELKRVGLDLTSRHLKQGSRYAVDAGCEWMLLTNGREWQLHHIEFGQPPVTKLVERWNLLEDGIEELAGKFRAINLRSLKRGALAKLWETTQVLAPASLIRAVVSPDVLRALRRVLRRETGIRVSEGEIVSGVRRMLNEPAAALLADVKVALPGGVKGRRAGKRGGSCTVQSLVEAGLIEPGSRLVADYREQRYEASVDEAGHIVFEGTSYRSPSKAGGAVTGKYGVSHPNGWTFWDVMGPGGELTKLAALRERFQKQDV